jgi:hypothetical protein
VITRLFIVTGLALFPQIFAMAQEVLPTHPITVAGRALDEKGNPIEDAEICLASPRTGNVIGLWYTNEKGEFRFENLPLPIEKADTNEGRDSGSFELFGKAERHAFAWRPIKWFYPDRKKVLDTSPANPPEEQQSGFGTEDSIVLDLKFGSPTTLRGRVVDDSGKGIPNARVFIKDAELWREERFASGNFESLNNERLVSSDMNRRQTDADGWFEFDQLPGDCVFWINIAPPGYSSRLILATTHSDAPAERDGKPLYKSGFEHKFARPRKVTFQVVYGDTKQPAERVGVGGAGFWETTKADGLVTVNITDGEHHVGINPRFGTAYLPTDHTIQVSEKSAAEPIELELDPGVEVNITVVDPESGKPLENVDVWWDQKIGDRTYQEVRGWRSWEVETRISHYEAPRTDKAGKMRILFPPGKHNIGVGMKSWPEGYEAVDTDGREIECELGKPLELEFEMRKL